MGTSLKIPYNGLVYPFFQGCYNLVGVCEFLSIPLFFVFKYITVAQSPCQILGFQHAAKTEVPRQIFLFESEDN